MYRSLGTPALAFSFIR